MKNSDLVIHRIKTRSPEWYKFRFRGIGCSEIRTVMYADDYSDIIVLFYKKLGLKKDIIDNEAMFHGRNLEDYVAQCWEHWDGYYDDFGEPNYIHNKENGNRIRRCRNMNGIVVNKNYPWLFGDPDRIINKTDGVNLITGAPLGKEGVLEVKTAEGHAANKWEYGIDPSYVTQLNGYLMILQLDYGEVALLKNGRYLSVFPFERNEMICQDIIDVTHDFWYKRVLPAQQHAKNYFKALKTKDRVWAEESLSAINSFEPEPSNNSEYEIFVKESYRQRKNEMTGTPQLMELAKTDKLMGAILSVVDELKQGNKNRIIQHFHHDGTQYYNFDTQGNLRYFIRQGASMPTLGNNIREKVDKQKILKILQTDFGL